MSERSKTLKTNKGQSPRYTKRRKNNDESTRYTREQYTVGWVCALSKELTAATAMLDCRHAGLPKPPNDPNTYTLGSIGEHNIVIACLPEGQIGNNVAATVSSYMVSAFPSVKVGLMVGIGGGIPPKVRLGDIVVSVSDGEYPGVVQWDLGKATKGSRFERIGSLNNPPTSLLTAVAKLKTDHEMRGSRIPMYLDDLRSNWPLLASKYLRSDSLRDILFKAGYSHVSRHGSSSEATSNNSDSETYDNDEDDSYDEEEEEESCRFCDKSQIVKRKPRDPRIHYGLIASGNQVIKDAPFRNKLNRDLGGNILCVEMEAAGLMNNFPCLIIRGICDYADSHKNNAWQEHAAASAAAYAKDLIQYVQASEISRERPVKEILEQVSNTISTVATDIAQVREKVDRKEDRQFLDWLTPTDYGPQQSDYSRRRQPGTGQWLLESNEFQDWLSAEQQTLVCPGMPGAGKTILTSLVVEYLHSTFYNNPDIGIAYIYCNYQRHNEQQIDILLASISKQLLENKPSLIRSFRDLYDQHKERRTRPSYDEILHALQSIVATYSRVYIVVDALDECQAADGCRTKLLTELFSLQTRNKTNIFATSRFIPEILDLFTTSSISLEIRASVQDVARYIEGHMQNLPLLVQLDKQLQQEITIKISEAVDGMFLLAQIYLRSLEDKFTRNDIRLAIEAFAKNMGKLNENGKTEVLNSAYEQALKRISTQMTGQKALAFQVLSWVTCAKRQLTTLELQHALATKPGKDHLDKADLPHVGDMVSVCAGLVTIDKESNIIRLFHYTTQRYLMQTQEQWFPGADSTIVTTCVSYLSFRAFESGYCRKLREYEERLRSNPLYDYAARHWGDHVPNSREPTQAIISFLQQQRKVSASSQVLLYSSYGMLQAHGELRSTRMTGLHLAGYFGISTAIDMLIESEQSLRVTDLYDRTPLFWSAQMGHVDAVSRLLERSDDAKTIAAGHDRCHLKPLEVAAAAGYLDIVERLLSAGADVNATPASSWGKTALQAAATGGYLDVVERLLVAGADVNAPPASPYVETALQAAARKGYSDVVDRLLVAGADANAPGSRRRQTALQAAAKGGYLDIVERLLVAGADINASHPAFRNGETALQAAALEGHLDVVEKLLVAGADVNATSAAHGAWTALHAAAAEGHLDIVESLLAAGADLNITYDDGHYMGCTALVRAAQEGSVAVVQRLVAAGAKPYGPIEGKGGGMKRPEELNSEVIPEIGQLMKKLCVMPLHTLLSEWYDSLLSDD